MNISIGRLPEDPQAQMVIRPDDERWQLIVDKDGFPHLYVRVKADAEGGAPACTGLLCIEDLLDEGTTIRDLMEGSFQGRLTPEEEVRAAAEFAASRAETGIPCPR